MNVQITEQKNAGLEIEGPNNRLEQCRKMEWKMKNLRKPNNFNTLL